jgi:hypothetical protein
MILKGTQQDADANNLSEYFDAVRQKNYEASFGSVQDFIAVNQNKFRHPRRKKPVRKWNWVLAVLFPVLIILACTKTEHTEPVGNTVSFSVPEKDDAAKQTLESLVGSLQTVITPDRHKPGYLSYTCFIPARHSQSADAVINRIKAIKGITGLSTAPMSARVRASLLSHLGYKFFSTHVDATALRDEDLQNTLMKQLKEKGITDISVTVTRNEKGARTLQLHPARNARNYSIDMTIDDKGTRMVLQEEKRTVGERHTRTEEPQVDFGSMTDGEVRDFIRSRHGKHLRDENIKISRTANEIGIDIQESDQQEQILRFKLH